MLWAVRWQLRLPPTSSRSAAAASRTAILLPSSAVPPRPRVLNVPHLHRHVSPWSARHAAMSRSGKSPRGGSLGPLGALKSHHRRTLGMVMFQVPILPVPRIAAEPAKWGTRANREYRAHTYTRIPPRHTTHSGIPSLRSSVLDPGIPQIANQKARVTGSSSKNIARHVQLTGGRCPWMHAGKMAAGVHGGRFRAAGENLVGWKSVRASAGASWKSLLFSSRPLLPPET